jgi:hypothetical protein
MARLEGILVEAERCEDTIGGLFARPTLFCSFRVSRPSVLGMAQESIDIITLINRPDRRP